MGRLPRMLAVPAMVAGCSPAVVTPPVAPGPPRPVVAEVDASAPDVPPTDPHLRCSDPSLWVCVE